jgi:hypothetical protein
MLTPDHVAGILQAIGLEAERVGRALAERRPSGLKLAEVAVGLADIRRRLRRLARRLEGGTGNRRCGPS